MGYGNDRWPSQEVTSARSEMGDERVDEPTAKRRQPPVPANRASPVRYVSEVMLLCILSTLAAAGLSLTCAASLPNGACAR